MRRFNDTRPLFGRFTAFGRKVVGKFWPVRSFATPCRVNSLPVTQILPMLGARGSRIARIYELHRRVTQLSDAIFHRHKFYLPSEAFELAHRASTRKSKENIKLVPDECRTSFHSRNCHVRTRTRRCSYSTISNPRNYRPYSVRFIFHADEHKFLCVAGT